MAGFFSIGQYPEYNLQFNCGVIVVSAKLTEGLGDLAMPLVHTALSYHALRIHFTPGGVDLPNEFAADQTQAVVVGNALLGERVKMELGATEPVLINRRGTETYGEICTRIRTAFMFPFCHMAPEQLEQVAAIDIHTLFAQRGTLVLPVCIEALLSAPQDHIYRKLGNFQFPQK